MVDQTFDQAMTHRCAGRPNTGWNVRRVAQKADRAFRNHLRGRSITGIAIAADRATSLSAILADGNEQEIVEAALALLLRRTFARLQHVRTGLLGIGGND